MERPMTVLWSRSAAVTLLVVRGDELHDERRDPVLHLGERQGIDDLVADAVEVLAAEMRLAPEVLELHGGERVRDLLRIGALRLLHRRHEREPGVAEIDAGRSPLAKLP